MDSRIGRGMEIREWELQKVYYIYLYTLKLCPLQKVLPILSML